VSEFARYLAAKRTVDDRALDRRLVDRLRTALATRARRRDGPLRVLEVGAGVGTMVQRFVDWAVLPEGETAYTAVDVQASNVARLRDSLAAWAAGTADPDDADGIRYADGERTVTVEGVTAEAASFVAAADHEWDLLVGAALLDILPTGDLPALLDGLAPGGLFYFPITFDGATRFRPSHPADRAVESCYHRHMDEKPGGSSRAGEETLAALRDLPGVELLGVAGSDWVVRPAADPSPDGETAYPGDEAFFLRYILDTVETALGELDRERLGDDQLADWLATRREQVTAGELVYLTHQLDFLGRVP
jgi:hypothetical protein